MKRGQVPDHGYLFWVSELDLEGRRAGLDGLGEGQKISFESKVDGMRGKTSAENLQLA